ncbi:Prolamin-like domain - like 10 [Theobroma cacao]|nr:Prolamin-like domain - like 10 [Theobroma cacao]
MDKPICHGIMAMVLALCVAAMVQPGQSQMAPESQLFIPRDGNIPPETLVSEKFIKNLFPKKGKTKKNALDIGGLIAECLGNYDNVKDCVAEVQEVFTTGDLQGLTSDCCDALTGIADDCLSTTFVRYLPQIRAPITTVTAYCSLVKTLQSYFN